jgi:hypothetical protein
MLAKKSKRLDNPSSERFDRNPMTINPSRIILVKQEAKKWLLIK